MIDIHNHILPGLDDGSQSLDESIRMAKLAVEEGIESIIATPHHANGKYENRAVDIVKAVEQLNAELVKQNIPLRIYSGQEIRVTDRFLEDMYQKVSIPLNHSKYILIEFPTNRIPSRIEEVLHELEVMQLIPILAHPERNLEIVDNPDKLYHLVTRGMLSQVTSHSINGAFGLKIQKISLDFCSRNLTHFIASDAHNLTHRAFGLLQSYNYIEAKLGCEYTDYFRRNARSVLMNQCFQANLPKKTKKMFQFWK